MLMILHPYQPWMQPFIQGKETIAATNSETFVSIIVSHSTGRLLRKGLLSLLSFSDCQSKTYPTRSLSFPSFWKPNPISLYLRWFLNKSQIMHFPRLAFGKATSALGIEVAAYNPQPLRPCLFSPLWLPFRNAFLLPGSSSENQNIFQTGTCHPLF